MATIVFRSSLGLLSVQGPCRDSDLIHVLDALDAFARPEATLVLDLSRLSVLSRDSARALLQKCRALEVSGSAVLVRVRPNSAVDRVTREVRGELGQRHLAVVS